MTIKEYIMLGKQQSAYWKSTGNSTGKIFSEETKQKTSWFKNLWNSAIGNGKQSGQKDFGSEEAYNDATQILDAGDFVNKMNMVQSLIMMYSSTVLKILLISLSRLNSVSSVLQ